ncbi:hypothetical protein RRG08_059081 [Elysia crispata]|uniref:Uncharacterized protein n=1 Tax=Elysia crispata TaxID=231223 RepID=A0AAE1B8F9_9GAST|nr:hypothetical protein RRG08_059081 [Elysia crispata]
MAEERHPKGGKRGGEESRPGLPVFKSLNRDKCLNDRAVSRQEAGDTSCSGLVRRSSHDGEPRERGVGGAEEGGEDVSKSDQSRSPLNQTIEALDKTILCSRESL